MKYIWKIGYLQAILIVSCLLLGALLAYNGLVVYPSFQKMLTKNTEEQAERVANYLISDVLNTSAGLQVDAGADVKIRTALDHFRLWKLKIFLSSGRCIYSTEAADVGKMNHSPIFETALPDGELLSKVVKKNGKSSEGQTVPLDIVETYIPIFGQGNFLGAFEIYYDITERKDRQDLNLQNSILVSCGISLLFFCVLIFILARAGKSIIERNLAEQKLIDYQQQLVESEKMASLGGLVAGVAHEINTPVGAAVTVASSLDERTRHYQDLMLNDQIKRSDLKKYFETAKTSASVILTSLRQAADLIKSFKQVAIDQSCQETRMFNVRQCIEDVLLSLKPKFRQHDYQVEINCAQDLEIDSNPGAITQICTNLVMNSLSHGFAERDRGKIRLDVQVAGGQLQLHYADDGVGMAPEILKNIFEPFFTTKRGQGGSGLGMHIIYNLVCQSLGGTISCKSSPDQGAVFSINIPLS